MVTPYDNSISGWKTNDVNRLILYFSHTSDVSETDQNPTLCAAGLALYARLG